ncbi:amino acid adenylation domain-containing protein [Chitinophaga varians]|uniref:Amino acid adenylation domain-containing protein n=1 Tax=Chitinophaga varians TaxID=2202339 RepID=A0A847SA92_9BACT|nr:non-ribosomal peptide synthetase [Chitinophaga varians]NLR68631.1 amino acid adenylation domain-containing protein [Chitinophaga varians]
MNKRVLSTLIDDWAARHPERIAVESTDGMFTYGNLSDATDMVAKSLAALSVKTGDIVAVYLPSSFKYIAGIIGVNKAGAIFMPLEVDYPPARLRQLLLTVKPAFVITTSALKDKLSGIMGNEDVPGLIWDDDSTAAGLRCNRQAVDHRDVRLPELDGNESNYLIYTSGSTGTPKIIEGVHKSLSHFVHWEVETFNLGPDVRCCQFAPVSFDVSFRDIFVPLLAGGTIVIPDASVKRDPRRLLEWLIDHSVTLVHIVPSYFRELTAVIRASGKPVSTSLKYILLAGEPLYGKDVKEWYDAAGKEVQLVNLYGPSETTLAKIYNRIREVPANAGEIVPLGHPISNTAIAIIQNGQLCNIGEIGEIYIKTPFRSKGYWGDPALTAASFIQNPLHQDYEDILYKTGDLGKYLADKSITYVGRIDSQVKIRGNRVELSEVMQTIAGYTGIKHTEVVSIEQEDTGTILCCYYTCDNGDIDQTELKRYLDRNLPAYMHPSYFVKLDAFPLNLNGKIDKKALPKPEDMLYLQQGFDPPENELEKAIADIWSSVLGIAKIGVNHSFFQLGGHSLTATKIVAGIHQKLHKQISLKDFFEHNTVSKLAVLIQHADADLLQPIRPVGKRAYYQATPAQQRIYLVEQLTDDFSAYNMSAAFKLSGAINETALQGAFNALLQKHEILRTTFVDIEGHLQQQVHDWKEMAVEHVVADQTSFSPQTAHTYIQDEMKRRFDLEKDLLWHVRLVHFADKQYLLQFTIHHIICDGWSMQVLTKDFLTAYSALAAGTPLLTPNLNVQYKDYSNWLWEKLKKDDNKRQYWHEKLGNTLPELYLPLDLPRPEVRKYEGDTIQFDLGTDLSGKIRNICTQQEASLFIFFEAVVKLLLMKISGQNDIVIGTPVAGRAHPELQDQVGLYLNYLALRTRIDTDSTFAALMRKIKNDTYESYQYQLYPFEKLAAEITGGAIELGRNPLYDVLVVMNNQGLNAADADIKELEKILGLEWIPVFDAVSKTDLTFFINESENISVNTEYRTDIFHKQTITKLNSDLLLLIEMVVKDIARPVEDVIEQLSGALEAEMLEKNQQLLNEDF